MTKKFRNLKKILTGAAGIAGVAGVAGGATSVLLNETPSTESSYKVNVQQGQDGMTAWTSHKHSFTGAHELYAYFGSKVGVQALYNDGSRQVVHAGNMTGHTEIPVMLFDDTYKTFSTTDNYSFSPININNLQSLRILSTWDMATWRGDSYASATDISPDFNMSNMTSRLISEENIDTEKNDIYVKSIEVKTEWITVTNYAVLFNAYAVTSYVSWLALDYDVVSK